MTTTKQKPVARKVKEQPALPIAQKEDIRAANPMSLQFKQHENETHGKAHARMLASPSVNAAVTMFHYHPMKEGVNISDLVDEVGKQALTVREGCMDRPEAMLVAQAHSLDAMFMAFSQRAAANMNAGYLPAMETFMRMALKAQSQCRTTLEALSEIKNPRSATFIKQQNVANQQQINNGVATEPGANVPACAHEKNITPTNELLENQHGKRMDTGTAAAPGAVNPRLATVAAVDRAKDAAGKAARIRKCA
jgi:hypothetical protein